MSKVSNCFKSVVRLADEEATEILDLAAHLRANDASHTEETAVRDAVKQLIAKMVGTLPAVTAPADPMGGMAAALTGKPTAGTALAEKVQRETSNGFVTRVNAAHAAGKITRNQADTLLEMGASDGRGMAKAKDELVRLDEKHSQKVTADKAAGKAWEDPDFSWQNGDPRWKDLSPAQRTTWTDAVKQNKASGDLFDHIVAEQKAISGLPKVDEAGDISAIAHPDMEGDMIDKFDPAFQNQKSAATWLSENAKFPFQRAIAKRLAAILGEDGALHLRVKSTDTNISPSIRTALENPRYNALSAINIKTGRTVVYVRDGQQISETVLLHELIHAATQKALRLDPALHDELSSIQVAIQRSLAGLENNEFVSDRGKEVTALYASTISDADELLAYVFSSPTLRSYLKSMKATGEFRTKADNAHDASIQTQAQSLWERLVEFVRLAIGLEPAFKGKLEQAIESVDAVKQAYLTENLTPKLIDRLDALFQKALEQYDTKVVPGQLSARTTNVDKGAEKAKGESAFDTSAMATPGKNKPANNVPGPDETVRSFNLPEFNPNRNPFADTLKDWAGGWRNKPAMLGWLTLRQIADRFKDIPGVQEFTALSQKMGGKSKALMAESHGIDEQWSRLDTATSVEMQKIMVESTMEQVWPNQKADSDANKELIKKDPFKANKHANLSKRYDALPDVAKRVFIEAQAKMRKDWDERGTLLRRVIVDQYVPELNNKFDRAQLDAIAATLRTERAAALKGFSRQEARSTTNMWSDLDDHAERLAQMQGPYFPLMRFGEHVVMAKSLDYQESAAILERAQEHLDALNQDDDTTAERLDRARKAVQEAKTAVEDMKDSESHYVVEFFESPTQAKERVSQLAAHFREKGQHMSVYTEMRAQHFGQIDSVSPAFMNKLQESLTNNLPDKDANAIRAAVRDLYIQSMPERSALKQQLRRLNVKGVKTGEMRRAFAASTMRSSWHLSRLEFGSQMGVQLNGLVNGDSNEQKIVGGEFARRLSSAFQNDPASQLATSLVSGISGISYFSYLGLSPSFLIMNMTQPWVISMPIMAGKFGLKKSTAELGKAWMEVATALISSAKEGKSWRFSLNLEKFSAENGEREMLTNLFNKGIIDVTLEHDLGSVAGGNGTTPLGKAAQFASLPAHHTEVVNRVSTALAAYRMARATGMTEGMNHADATKYAEGVVADTHLDYSPENAPRFMRSTSLGGLGRIVFQFKKYMQGMIFLNMKLLKDSFSGDTQVAKESRRAFVYLTGMQFATSGAVGLPIAAPISLIALLISKMYPPDDQPELFQSLYYGVKDAIGETAARLLFKGIPAAAGIDVSGKLGQGGILNPLAFMASGKQGADWVAAATMALAGPAVSMAANWADGISMAGQDPIKAVEKVLPRFLSDPIKAMDRTNRGITNKRGDTIMGPEEFGPFASVMRSMGFEKTDVTDMYDARNAMIDAKQGRDDTRKQIIAAAVKDHEGMQSKIDDFNSRHPEKGERITGATIAASAKSTRMSAAQLRDGVRVRKQDSGLADRLGLDAARGMQ